MGDDSDDILKSLEDDASGGATAAQEVAAEISREVPGGGERRQALYGVNVEVVAILGTAELQISQILKLGRGAVVELERYIGEPIDIRANSRLIARGEVVVMEDRLAVQVTEVIKSGDE